MLMKPWARLCGWLTALIVAASLVACASTPKLVPHAFNFDGLKDKWAESVDLLAYAYGDGYSMVREDPDHPSTSLFAGKPSLPSGNSVYGPMPVGEFLFVKWRLRETGEVLERRVDLRARLPQDMTEHELTFVIDGRQLYVYVVTPRRKRSYDEPPWLRTWRSEYAFAYEIFPTLEKR